MIHLFLAAAALVPPPAPGDDRTAILASVKDLVVALTSGDREGVEALLEGQGSFVAVDRRKAGTETAAVRSFADILAELDSQDEVLTENLGIPTVMQRGPIAHVWVPYAFAVKGKPTHCGIDSFTLVRRDDRWRTTGVVYTIEPLTQCTALGSPPISKD